MANSVMIRVTLGELLKRIEYLEQGGGNSEAIQSILQDLKNLKQIIDFLDKNKVGSDVIDDINNGMSIIIKDVGIINSLLAGNITSENIQTGGITSDKLVISDGFITNAMIKDLNALKINAGIIKTNLVQVQSENGNLNIIDNTLQILDKEGNLRVSLGEYEGDYNLVVRAKDGKTVIFNSEGVTEKGITEGLIKDFHIKEGTITGRKIDLSSLISVINKYEGTEKILSSKVYLNESEQTLEVAFKELFNSNSDLKETTSSLITNFKIEQGRITQIIEDTTIEKDGEKILLKDAYSRTVETVEGMKSTIGEQTTSINELTGAVEETSNTVNELTRTVDSMSSTIKDTTIKVEGFEDKLSNINVSDTNLVINSSFMTGDTSFWNSSGSGTVYEVELDAVHDYALKTTKQFLIGTLNVEGSVKENDRMCISFYAKSNVAHTFTGAHAFDGGSIEINDRISFATTNVWKKYTFLFNAKSDGLDTHKLYFYGAGEDSKILYLTKIKLSVSSRDSKWTPSPLDADLFLNRIEQNLNTMTDDGIISIPEKRQLLSDFENIKSDNKIVADSCTKYGVDINSHNYKTNYDKLYSYLYGAAGILLNPSIPTVIDRNKFRQLYSSYFDSRTLIRNMITEASKNFVDASIDKIQVGNRNLILNSTFLLGENKLESWNNVDKKFTVLNAESDKPQSNILFIQSYGEVQNKIYSAYSNRFKVLTGEPYTVSLDFRVDDISKYDLKNPLIVEFFAGSNKIQTEEMTIADMGVEVIKNNEWVRLFKVIKPLDDRIMQGQVRLTLYKNGSVSYREIKLERGNKHTDWSPAPEDVDKKITKVSSKVSEISQSLEDIIMRVSNTETSQEETSGVLSSHEERIASAELKLTPEAFEVTVSATDTIKNLNKNLEEVNKGIEETDNNLKLTNEKIDEVAKNVNYTVEIVSSNGSIFKNGNISTTLSAIVRKGMSDITATIDSSKFKWTRVSSDSAGDIAWNNAHSTGTKSIKLTGNDVKVRATFNCEVSE